MPVRKIPKNYLFVTGSFSSRKIGEMAAFESLLEKELLILLEFDDSVQKFEVQPVRIPVPDVRKRYVPDVLVHFFPDLNGGDNRKPLLVEVKSSWDLKRNEKKYAPKFEAARRFADEQGWIFVTRDERHIRIPRLANLKFLREYRNVHPSAERIQKVLDWIGDAKTSSLEILAGIAPTDDAKLLWLPVLWSMVVAGHLITDLDLPFTGDVLLERGRTDV